MAQTVFVVEDHEDMRLLYRRLLRRSGISMVGESATAEEALKEVPSLNPDLVVIDISLPGMDGIELVRRLREFDPVLCLLVATGHEVARYEAAAMAAGADGIVSKEETEELMAAIKQLLRDRRT